MTDSTLRGLTFVPLPEADVAGFMARSQQVFVDGRVAAGEDRHAVEKLADSMHAKVLPEGRLSPAHRIGNLHVAAEVVGHLWVERVDAAHWYVWDVAIEPSCRGRGFGRGAMGLAEDIARADGASAIGLSVLATNLVALELYRSMGYSTDEPQAGQLLGMTKQLRVPRDSD
jgi:ribosomal protein S18 acetylase RimI-like enzyme